MTRYIPIGQLASLNRVFLIGWLGKDPVIKHFSPENCIAEVTLATNSGYFKDEKWIDKTDWHNLRFPRTKLAAKLEQSAFKGSLIQVEGRIEYSEYQKKGELVRRADIVVDQFQVLASPRSSITIHDPSADMAPYSPTEIDGKLPPSSIEDIPF